MKKLLVSSCLLGNPVRYDGNALTVSQKQLRDLRSHFDLYTLCPEVSAGLPTPRPPAELIQIKTQSKIKIMQNNGIDVTNAFIKGAYIALAFCKEHNIELALLTESSPSCGSSTVYDGTFSGTKMRGQGVTASLLSKNNIQVFNQHQIDDLMNKYRDRKSVV